MSEKLEKLYLSSLLFDVPVQAISKIIHKESWTEEYLKIAEKYVAAGRMSNQINTFVASPFEQLKKKGELYAMSIPSQELSLSKTMFPSKDTNHRTSENTEKLWDKFVTELEMYCKGENPAMDGNIAIDLLYKYAISIPNPGGQYPEISWFDYTKSRSGIVLSLFSYLEERGGGLEIKDEEEPLLLLRADLSGIQDFLENIASKNASKNLKGRSFYLQLLADTVLEFLLQELGLFQSQVMYASGGNFFLLLPNTDTVRGQLDTLEKTINRKLFKTHQTEISLVMGYLPVSQQTVVSGGIHASIGRLFTDVIDKKKKQKFKDLLSEDFEKFFEPGQSGGDSLTDAITGEEIEGQVPYKIADNLVMPIPVRDNYLAETEEPLKELTAKQIFLGHHLKNIDYLVFTNRNLNLKLKRANEYLIEPAGLGINVYLVVKEKDVLTAVQNALVPVPPADYKIVRINDLSQGEMPFYTYGFLYGGNKVPVLTEEDVKNENIENDREAGQRKFFHELSIKPDSKFKRLGVLRMDVDSLGSIFKIDVKRPGLSFAYYASISRHLDWFFKGYINTIWEENALFKDNIQIVFSGGDDLFLVGRWDAIISFAEKLKEEFFEYTCGAVLAERARITLSGGISMVTDKFPILKASEFASEAEHDAKLHVLLEEGKPIFFKNSISLLGKPLHWESEYQLVVHLKNYLVDMVGSQYGVSKSLLHKIMQHAASAAHYSSRLKAFDKMSEEEKKKTPKPSPSWIWTASYDLARFAERVKGENKALIRNLKDVLEASNKEYFETFFKEKEAFTKEVSKAVLTNRWVGFKPVKTQYYFLELLAIAARWAELEIRNTNN